MGEQEWKWDSRADVKDIHERQAMGKLTWAKFWAPGYHWTRFVHYFFLTFPSSPALFRLTVYIQILSSLCFTWVIVILSGEINHLSLTYPFTCRLVEFYCLHIFWFFSPDISCCSRRVFSQISTEICEKYRGLCVSNGFPKRFCGRFGYSSHGTSEPMMQKCRTGWLIFSEIWPLTLQKQT